MGQHRFQKSALKDEITIEELEDLYEALLSRDHVKCAVNVNLNGTETRVLWHVEPSNAAAEDNAEAEAEGEKQADDQEEHLEVEEAAAAGGEENITWEGTDAGYDTVDTAAEVGDGGEGGAGAKYERPTSGIVAIIHPYEGEELVKGTPLGTELNRTRRRCRAEINKDKGFLIEACHKLLRERQELLSLNPFQNIAEPNVRRAFLWTELEADRIGDWARWWDRRVQSWERSLDRAPKEGEEERKKEKGKGKRKREGGEKGEEGKAGKWLKKGKSEHRKGTGKGKEKGKGAEFGNLGGYENKGKGGRGRKRRGGMRDDQSAEGSRGGDRGRGRERERGRRHERKGRGRGENKSEGGGSETTVQWSEPSGPA